MVWPIRLLYVVEKISYAAVLAILACLILSFLPIRGPSAPVRAVSSPSPVIFPATPALKPYEQYETIIKKRDLFDTALAPAGSNDVNPNPGAGNLPPNLKMVGIMVGSPSEVVIEDTGTQQTYFVVQGQENNGISIQSIQADQVILNYQGQAVTLPFKGGN